MASRIERAASGFEDAARSVAKLLLDAAEGLGPVADGPTAKESSTRLADQFEAMLTELRSLSEASRQSGQNALAAVAEQVSEAAAGFERTAAKVAEALEGAAVNTRRGSWAKGVKPNGPRPDLTVRDDVRSFLLTHFGDPRLRRGLAGGRAGRCEPHAEVASGHLSQGFLELIADHALDEHFKYRRAFWSSYLDVGAIDEAWLALGKHVYNKARTSRNSMAASGDLKDRASAETSRFIIILRVGSLVFCEWSHNGRIRAWKANSNDAPRLGTQRNASAMTS